MNSSGLASDRFTFYCFHCWVTRRMRRMRRKKPPSRCIRISGCFRGESQFRTWVLSIARNEGLGRLRKVKSRREDSLEADTDETTGDYTPAILTSWDEVPLEALERKELGEILRGAIRSLPVIYRNVVLLRDIEEMDVRETAQALGISEGSVKVRLHRARALLQKALAPKLKGFVPKRRGMFGWVS